MIEEQDIIEFIKETETETENDSDIDYLSLEEIKNWGRIIWNYHQERGGLFITDNDLMGQITMINTGYDSEMNVKYLPGYCVIRDINDYKLYTVLQDKAIPVLKSLSSMPVDELIQVLYRDSEPEDYFREQIKFFTFNKDQSSMLGEPYICPCDGEILDIIYLWELPAPIVFEFINRGYDVLNLSNYGLVVV